MGSLSQIKHNIKLLSTQCSKENAQLIVNDNIYNGLLFLAKFGGISSQQSFIWYSSNILNVHKIF